MSFLQELPFSSYHPPKPLSAAQLRAKMDRIKPWQAPPDFNPFDNNSLNEENDRLRRALCAMTRAYNSTKRELEDIKEAAGFSKTLPFLSLPREVRDQVYSYALLVPSNIKPEPRPIHLLSLEPLCWKPPTPSLCLVNKQIHDEAIEVLYRENTFCFQNPGELLRFEDQIGDQNRNLIRSLEISMSVFAANSLVPVPDLIAPCDWQGVPTHWSKALLMSKLKNVVEMTITAEDTGSSERNSAIICPVLQQATEDMLQRNENGELKRRLTLKGFDQSARRKFLSGWDVRIEQWEELDDEVMCTWVDFD
jgi:hypothetical protein